MVVYHEMKVNQFTYLGGSIASSETNVNIRIDKTWTAIDRFSTKWKSDLYDKIKRKVFQSVTVPVLLYGCTTRTLAKR